MADRKTHPTARTDRKAVLFCPACGHDAPVDGGWSVARTDGDRTDVECPECGELVVSQPRFDAPSRWNPFAGIRPLLQFVNALVRHDVL
ncbi:hypothetical protein [Natronomonas marina]|jgi:predicted RNA-binding Zn-ribbon protein involved in translation (DUF1610 family)|uniref:hypothetical protein n=1 Tax=Natronomonas marina TaxID=2961939 RepID=UPI0020CA2602|nr:hypothetical protein [Natronomonas marina]